MISYSEIKLLMIMAISVENHFYIDLVSNVNDYSMNNKIGNFRTKLAQTVNLGDDEWEAKLSEIIFTKTWCNILSKQMIWLISSEGSVLQNPYYLEPGFYENDNDLLKEVNANLLESFLLYAEQYKIEASFRPPVFEHSNRTNLVTIKTGKYVQKRTKRRIELLPFIGHELQRILGLDLEYQKEYENYTKDTQFRFRDIKLIKDSLNGHRPVDLSRGTTGLFVYCDIIKPSLVGDTFAQILRVISIPKVDFGETVHKHFDAPHYYPLTACSFNAIEINTKDDTGETIQFAGGRLYVKLHFRRE